MRTCHDHPYAWRDVHWRQRGNDVLEALPSRDDESLVVRVRQGELVRDIVGHGHLLARNLESSGVDLDARLDLEIITANPTGETTPPSPTSEDFTDRNDFNTLQWNGERGTGELPSHPLRRAPMFFRDNGMHVDLIELHRGQSVFLVLNGSSLADFDWSLLRQDGLCTFGVNNGGHGFRPHFWTCVDDPTRFMESIWRDPTITKFVPMAHFQKPIWNQREDCVSREKVRNFPNVIGYRRNEAFQPAQWLFEDTINWGNHSRRGGGRSVMLAALRIIHLLGFRQVYLVGCDFHMDDQHRYWFPEQRSSSAISNNQNAYAMLAKFFSQLQPHFLAADFHVFNTNPDSHLKVFPHLSLEEAIARSRIDTGGSTQGMYVDRYRDHRHDNKGDGNRQDAPSPAQARQTHKNGVAQARVKGLKAINIPTTPDNPARSSHEDLVTWLVEAIRSAPVESRPFTHIRLQQTFPPDLYRRLLDHLPADRHYSELRHRDAIQPDGHSARLRFSFTSRELAALEPESRAFWSSIRHALSDRRLEIALRKALAEGLRLRFGAKADQVRLRPVPVLIRDLVGYRIGVHTDIAQKVITTQFYLPTDTSQRHLGTALYEKDDRGRTTEHHTLPFLPATGYAFAVHDHSWHGVKKMNLDNRPRNSLMLTYYIAPS